MVPEQLSGLDALLLGRRDVERHDRQHRAVHGHADAHLVERDAAEQGPRVVDRVDRHAGHPDVAAHARVVGVVAAVGGQVERDAQALLSGREVAAVERVGLLGGREAGVLPDRPGPGGVHRRVRTPQVRREAGPGGERVEALEVVHVVARLDVDALRGAPRLAGRAGRALGLALTHQRQAGEALRDRHDSASLVRVRKSMASTPRAHESSAQAAGFPATTTRRRARGPQCGGGGLAPTRRTPRRCRPGRRRPDRSRLVTRSSTPVVAPATSTAIPPAASRLVAKPARGVWAATGPSVARNTWAAGGSRRSASNAAPQR